MPCGDTPLPLDVRYRYERRDYENPNPFIDPPGPVGPEKRDDRIHSTRARLEVPLVGPVGLQLEYEYEDFEILNYEAHPHIKAAVAV